MSNGIWRDDNWCLACGEDNPHGLHLKFRREGEDYVSDFTPQRYHQGWAGVVHGGVLAILLDEAMNDMLSRNGEPVATAELTVRYHRPARVGVPLQVRARLARARPPLYQAEAEVTDAEGTLVATGTAKLMRIEADLQRRA
ncbi:MAG: PaaI family thioesterase [Armatimonadota bacterium]